MFRQSVRFERLVETKRLVDEEVIIYISTCTCSGGLVNLYNIYIVSSLMPSP